MELSLTKDKESMLRNQLQVAINNTMLTMDRRVEVAILA